MRMGKAVACLTFGLVLTLTAAAQERSKLPHRAEVVPGKLYVTVYAHDIKTSGTKVHCWSFVSEGLERQGQHEIVFSLRRPRGKTWEDFSQEILGMFEGFYANAEQGNRVEAYDGSIMATDALFLANKSTWGLIYIPAEMFDGVEVPFEALSAVLIKGDEVEVMAKSSALRLASMLGAEYEYYPCPPWSDPSRKPVVSTKQFGKSVLSKVTQARTPGLMVSRVGTDEISMISLGIEGSAAPALGAFLAGLPERGAVALMANPAPEATMRYSWMPDVGKTGVIFAKYGLWVTGSFALLVFGEGVEDKGKILEDGISLFLGPSSWNKLKTSIASLQPAKIPLGKDVMFTTAFLHISTFDPLKPKPFVPRHIGLYQSQEELRARLGDMSSLNDYVQLFESAVSSALAGGEQGDARGFLIAVGVKPGKKVMHWCEAIEGSLPEETLNKLETLLGNIPPIEVKDGPVAFILKGALWGREVKAFPEYPSAWSKALEASGRPFTSLDDLLKIIWPD